MGKFRFYDDSGLADCEIYLKIEKCIPGDIPLYIMSIVTQDTRDIVGQITLQVAYSAKVYYGGHIGYRVAEEFRGHNYALKACRLMFKQAKKHKMNQLIITCNPDNIPSRRTLEKLGGFLREIVPLPEQHELYARGDREKCIFLFKI
ncbi:MAG: GNAT family N-acetyltransferase [Defluviitaleaceae bacterium]|nr:GNAT family N-acetyltransferase [Defluviitaleaceae bacterium]